MPSRAGGNLGAMGDRDTDQRGGASRRGRPRARTTGEAARIIGEALGCKVSTEQVRRWIDKGLLGGTRVGDSWYRTNDRAIEIFIEGNTLDTSAQAEYAPRTDVSDRKGGRDPT